MAQRPICTGSNEKKTSQGSCADKRCLYPEICPQMEVDHGKQRALLKRLRGIEGIKKVFVASGIRYDLLFADRKQGIPYLREVVRHHISGQMKVAPEHTQDHVLNRMGKPGWESFFNSGSCSPLTKAAGREQYLTYYLIAAHPGCTEQDMRELKRFVSRKLEINPEQVQIFTPTPSTYSSLMYYTGWIHSLEKTFRGKGPDEESAPENIVLREKGGDAGAGQEEILPMSALWTGLIAVLAALAASGAWMFSGRNRDVVSKVTTLNPQGEAGTALVVYHPGKSDFQDRCFRALRRAWLPTAGEWR